MSDILQQVMALETTARLILLEGMFQAHMADWLVILKSADGDTRDAFYRSFPGSPEYVQEIRSHFEKELERVESPDPERRQQAEQCFSQVFSALDDRVQELEEDSRLVPAQVRAYREVMKSGFVRFPHILSDQRRGVPYPPAQKPYDPQAERIALPSPTDVTLKKSNILDCIRDRKSQRRYTDEPLSLQELAYLLWATQGLRWASPDGAHSLRTVPSGGARHPLETYLAVLRIESLRPGIYRYLPLEHKLLYLFTPDDLVEQLNEAVQRQTFVGSAAVTFIWSVIPYRCEWRYTIESKKIILQDSGHVCQNLYLACESIACGTVAIGAYDQEKMDRLLRLDGEDEFTIYVAPVGRVPNEKG